MKTIKREETEWSGTISRFLRGEMDFEVLI